jgi:GR25 family glycosyltransferase involved in LPS biosynthesis
MKSFVITIKDLPESLKCAERCIKSGKKYGIDIKHFYGVTPRSEPSPVRLAELDHIPLDGFKEKFSRFENCLSAFLSHYSLWQLCANDTEDYLILEHDAVFEGEIKDVFYKGVLSYGAPSYGKYITPSTLGVNKLISKQYLPGAHAYRVKPKAAKELVAEAKTKACPTDLYLSNYNFAFIEEYYPWPVVAKDTFSTIQNKAGCIAKHNYQKYPEIYELK